MPQFWLDEGRTIEVELPRNLTCAKCGGGGCGVCQNAGAITLRSRTELPELVQVVLPISSLVDGSAPASERPPSEAAPRSDKRPTTSKSIVIRVPECGGLPDASQGQFIRGWLLLQVDTAAEASSNVTTLDEDAIDSSKMLRAAVRSSGKCSTQNYKAVVLPRRSRSAPAQGDSQAARGPSQAARGPSKAASKLPEVAPPVSTTRPSMRMARTRTASSVQWIYVAVVVFILAVAAFLLLL